MLDHVIDRDNDLNISPQPDPTFDADLVDLLDIDISDYRLTREEVAERYRVTPSAIGKWNRRRVFPNPLVIGRRAYWSEADLQKFDGYSAAKSIGQNPPRPAYSLPHSGPPSVVEASEVSYED